MVSGPKKNATLYLNAAMRSRDLGTFVEPSSTTLDAYLDRWLEAAAKPRVRPRTLQDYHQLLRLYVRPALGARRLDQIRALDLQTLYSDLGQHVTALTVQKAHRVLSQALKQAVRWRLLSFNPGADVALPRDQRPEMRSLTAAQAEAFIRAAEAYDREPEGSLDGRTAGRLPRGIVFAFTLATGMRPGEVLALRWEDVDLDAGRATVRRNLVQLHGGTVFGEPKSRAGRRVIPLPSSMTARLRAHRKWQAKLRLLLGAAYQDEDLVFASMTGATLNPQNLTHRDLKAILNRAELPASLRWYDLRHTCATLLLAAGENVKVVAERLGHAKVALTLDLYAHVLPGMQERAAERLEAALFGAS
jgi:integrase